MRKFKFYYDAAHGWLKVHKLDLYDVDLTPEDFSSFSYRDGEWLYLEEDCDASKFIREWERKSDTFLKIVAHVDHGYDSPIRNLPRIK